MKSKLFWLLTVAVIGIGIVLYFLSRPPGNEPTDEASDKAISIDDYDDTLDAFRAEWDIFGRFENWPTMLPLAKMAKIAYDKPADAERLYQEMGFAKATPIHSPLHTQIGYVVSGEDVLVIAFRGSDDTEDWLLNVNQYIHQGEDGGMHAGFATCYSTLRQEILTAIRAADPNAKHIWITGHSLGGAIALICAYDLQRYQDMEFDGVFTFGQPMIGREQFTGYLQNNLGHCYVHFVNELDGVPRIPAGFSHCGRLIHFKNGKVLTSKRYLRMMTASNNGINPAQDFDIEFVDDENFPKMSEAEFDQLQDKLRAKENQLFPQDQVIPNETLKWEDLPPELRQPLRTNLPLRLGSSGQKETGEININDPELLEQLPVELQKFKPGTPVMTGFVDELLPWKKDHSMSEYIEKIEARIENVKLRDDE